MVECWQKSYQPMITWCKENDVSFEKLKYWRAKLKLEGHRHIQEAVLDIYPNVTQIYLYNRTMDMHKSFDHFKMFVDSSLKEISKNSLFVFLGKRRSTLKIFSFNSASETIWYKRLSRGTFLWKNSINSSKKQGDFYLLL